MIVATILPLSFLQADPANIIQNGDFSGGPDASPWVFYDIDGDVLDIGGSHGPIFTLKFNDEGETQISQNINANNLNFRLSFEACRVNSGQMGYYFLY